MRSSSDEDPRVGVAEPDGDEDDPEALAPRPSAIRIIAIVLLIGFLLSTFASLWQVFSPDR